LGEESGDGSKGTSLDMMATSGVGFFFGVGRRIFAVKKIREICPKTITLLICILMDNHQTCSTPITSPK
jgi:hypothetical protein